MCFSLGFMTKHDHKQHQMLEEQTGGALHHLQKQSPAHCRSKPWFSSVWTPESHQGSREKSHSNNSTSGAPAESNQLTASSLRLLMHPSSRSYCKLYPACCSRRAVSRHRACAWILHQQHQGVTSEYRKQLWQIHQIFSFTACVGELWESEDDLIIETRTENRILSACTLTSVRWDVSNKLKRS